jgi:hypothetical protein
MNNGAAFATMSSMALRVAEVTGLPAEDAEQALRHAVALIAVGRGYDLDLIDRHTIPHGFWIRRR